ncbi:MAG: thioredoxin family protein [Acidimicrobiia bacterium]|nr:thioredoxin family protein [Acidimicrobiia bacterium]
MDSTVLRVILVLAVLGVATAAAVLARRLRPQHPPIDIEGLGFAPGVVVFTSTDCPRCKPVLAAARASGAPLREVTYELEGDLQRRAGVVGVPLTIVLDQAGKVSAQIAGRVSSSRLQRAVARAGF